MVTNMLQNLSHGYSSHNSNIKCVSSIIKCIDFESIHYDINLDVISSFMNFRYFDLCFYQCITSLNQLNYFSLQKKL